MANASCMLFVFAVFCSFSFCFFLVMALMRVTSLNVSGLRDGINRKAVFFLLNTRLTLGYFKFYVEVHAQFIIYFRLI